MAPHLPAKLESTTPDNQPRSRPRAPSVPSTGPPDRLPLWFERWLVLVIAAVVSFGAVGLLLTFLGHYAVLPVLAGGLPGTVVLARLGWPRRPPAGSAGRSARLPAVGMCVVALGFLLWNGLDAGHYVSVDRDPGVYAAAGKWLSSHNGLEVQAGRTWTAKGREFDVASAGMYPEPGGRLEFQFNHLAPVLFAEAGAVGGDKLLFAMPALLGALALCAIYAAGCRLVPRHGLVLAAVTALGVSLPQMSVARDTYSETSAQLLLWAGLWLLLTAYERRRLGVGLLGGIAMGATMLSRVDALVYLVPLPTLAAMALLAARSGRDRRFLLKLYAVVALGALPMTLIGTFDVMFRAGGYYAALHRQVVLLQLGFAASGLTGLLLLAVWPRLSSLRTWVERARPALGATAAGVAVVGLLLAWSVRPAVQHSRGANNPTTVTIQVLEGLPVDGRRTYNEQTMVWMGWYLGAFVLLCAIVGIGLLLSRTVRRPDPAGALLLTVAGIGTALYLWSPQITPTQIWATRRFVPAALPFLVLASAYALDRASDLLPRLGVGNRRTKILPVGAAVALVAFPLGTVLPVRSFESQAGFLSVVNKTCHALGARAAVVFVPNDRLRLTMPQTIRGYCGVPATKLTGPLTPARMQAVAGAWRAEGRTLWVLGSSPTLIEKSLPGLRPTFMAGARNVHLLNESISRPATQYRTELLEIYAARIGS